MMANWIDELTAEQRHWLDELANRVIERGARPLEALYLVAYYLDANERNELSASIMADMARASIGWKTIGG